MLYDVIVFVYLHLYSMMQGGWWFLCIYLVFKQNTPTNQRTHRSQPELKRMWIPS